MKSPVKKSYLYITAVILSAIGMLPGCDFNQHPELTITECEYNNERYFGVAELIINNKSFTIDCSSSQTLELDFEEQISQLSLEGNAGGDLSLMAPKSITMADDQVELNLIFTDELEEQADETLTPSIAETPIDEQDEQPDIPDSVDSVDEEAEFMMPDEFMSQQDSDDTSADRNKADTPEQPEITEESATPPAPDGADSNNAELVFQVQPASSEVTLVSIDNGQSFNFNASSGAAEVPPGNYDWTANADGYNSSSGSIDISAGRNVIVTVLEEELIMGRIMIDVQPENAIVNLEDQNSNDDYALDADESGNIPVGMYSYAILADGYETSTGTIEIKENERTSIAEVLNVSSLVDYIEELRNTNQVNQARQLVSIAPGDVPDLSPENKNTYYNELYRLATLIYNDGYISESVSLYEKIIDEYNRAYQARLSLANYYITNSDSERGFETARDILSPLFGSLRFNIPTSERAEVELMARYYYALSYYEQVYITSDRDQRSVISRQAISQLREAEARIEDAIARGQVSSEMEEYKAIASEYIAIIESDLIYQN